MTVRNRGSWVILLAVWGLGCGSRPVKSDALPPNEYTQFMRIGHAYIQANTKLKRGPRDLKEFTPFLQAEPDGQQLVDAISSNTFVVIWGLRLADLELQKGPDGAMRPPVLAYQAQPKEGKRYVLLRATQVDQMSDAQFKSAFFPRGHKPA